ncbi:hypothetical protein A2643_04105 [Candidatus Nomurabacteria bacterium RIFCSPHIGHO2_01_FULL_39_220]|nr:MAG: hypothetical protein A3C75_02920 [Candidatus Giovannonibacteria bacterium RIFCSPHIGHO2_02_FULL_44_31]OGF76366.1 MAG: hypothetical protein A3E62_03175 [Candidatus Giovannonibacteria bacterium RIFCSPHIGHO2_12_FULL_44_29]OGI69593.1 MAG: hypothetical protein A2643_04105 [Candidatus Nomurabacteria bacterium RIFCSPHIGHO2_01_FULL_39_220]OGI90999.1 MAG: hypothetical protein A3A06_02705 [Candidatus Nomurabacteria bacterium RIFCSPLOWO2_01_FULL_41_220]
MATVSKNKSNEVLRDILKEIRILRMELFESSAIEDLNDFSNPERIKKSYLKALKKYPVRS